MKRVVRVVVYEGEDYWVDKTLSRSANVGRNQFSPYGSVTILEYDTIDSHLEAELRGFKDQSFIDVDKLQ